MIVSLLTSCNRVHKVKDKVREKKDRVVNKALGTIVDFIRESAITDYSLFDKFPELKRDEFKITEIGGILCTYLPWFDKYYFKYTGDSALIQQYIENIECKYTEIEPDTAFVQFTDWDYEQYEKKMQSLTDYEKQRAAFFFEYQNENKENLIFYKCRKTPENHILILDLRTNLIHHLIESFRE